MIGRRRSARVAGDDEPRAEQPKKRPANENSAHRKRRRSAKADENENENAGAEKGDAKEPRPDVVEPKPTPLSPSRTNRPATPVKNPHAPRTPSSLRKAVLPASRKSSSPIDANEENETGKAVDVALGTPTKALASKPPLSAVSVSTRPKDAAKHDDNENEKPTGDALATPTKPSAPKPPPISTLITPTKPASPSPHTPNHPPDPLNGNITPSHPTARSLDPLLSAAKKLFRRSTKPPRFVGRTAERQQIADFLKAAESGQHGALYVAGCPGSGKSALVRDILSSSNFGDMKIVFLNCMSLANPSAIYARILEEFGFDVPKKEVAEKCEEVLCGKRGKKRKSDAGENFLLILDEVDYLSSHASVSTSASSTSSTILPRIFGWPFREHSHISIMGIANALDLTSNLHALKLSGAEPTLLNFEPYTEKEIMEIIRDRLKEVGDVVQEQAILLAAKKSAGTGDLRRALDVVRQAIELYESEQRKRTDSASPITTHKVTLRHVNAATTQSMGTASTLSDKVRSLSFIQKAVLLAVFLAGKKKDRSVRGALKEFDVVARKLGIPVPSRTELSDILMTLSTYVLVSRESKGRIATPKETDPLRIELSDAQLKVGLDDPLATEDAEGKGNKALMNIFEAWEREEKRKAVLGGEGTDLVDD